MSQIRSAEQPLSKISQNRVTQTEHALPLMPVITVTMTHHSEVTNKSAARSQMCGQGSLQELSVQHHTTVPDCRTLHELHFPPTTVAWRCTKPSEKSFSCLPWVLLRNGNIVIECPPVRTCTVTSLDVGCCRICSNPPSESLTSSVLHSAFCFCRQLENITSTVDRDWGNS